MNRLLALGLVLLACIAHAGGNPDIRIYIDFDPPNYAHSVQPEVYTSVEAYVCLDQIGEGVSSIAFGLSDVAVDCPGVLSTGGWVCYWDLWIGGLPPNESDVIVANLECVHEDPSILGYIPAFYLGGECCLRIVDHTQYPRQVVDCSDPGEVDLYCVLAHGAIGDAACPEGDCAGVPAESETWGTIKSLYR